jgi:SSS family solute:Na+ symporter
MWKRGTAAGALTSMLIGALVVLGLQLTGFKPLGWWAGVRGFLVSIGLYIFVSLLTEAPVLKAEAFMSYLQEELPKRNCF